MEGKVGENHPGHARIGTAEARAERILAEELARLHWSPTDLIARPGNDPTKLALAARMRQETTLTVKRIAERLNLGKPKGARTNLHKFMNSPEPQTPQSQLELG